MDHLPSASAPTRPWLDLVAELSISTTLEATREAVTELAAACGLELQEWEPASPEPGAPREAFGPANLRVLPEGEDAIACVLGGTPGLLMRLSIAQPTGREEADVRAIGLLVGVRLAELSREEGRATAREAALRIADGAGIANGVAMETLCGASQVNTHVASVAAATEEMAATIREISRSASSSAGVVRSASELSSAASSSMHRLEEASRTIGRVTQLIGKLASQTNLLALNARVEAARAGEAGQGFAVVAGEVKGLAHQTQGATTDIEAQVKEVQEYVAEAAQAITSVAEVISEVDRNAGSIAAAVEQQGAAVKEITDTVAAAAAQLDQVVERLSDVGEATMGFESDARACVAAL